MRNCIADVDICNNVETNVIFVLWVATFFLIFILNFFLTLILDPFDVVTTL